MMRPNCNVEKEDQARGSPHQNRWYVQVNEDLVEVHKAQPPSTKSNALMEQMQWDAQ